MLRVLIDRVLRKSKSGGNLLVAVSFEQAPKHLSRPRRQPRRRRFIVSCQSSTRVQGKADPSDVVQDAFLQAHRDFAGFRGHTEAELVQWLRSIMTFQVGKLIRRYETKGRDIDVERQLQEEIDQSSRAIGHALASPGTSPSQRAVRRQREVLLADALERLPDHYRDVMILHHLEGLAMPEVVLRMGRSLDSVRKLWARALVKLRELLEDHADEG